MASRALVGLGALALAMGGCAAPTGLTELAPAPAGSDAGASAQRFADLLTELHAHFEVGDDDATRVISDGASVAVAVAELDAAFGLSGGAVGFVSATAAELIRRAGDGPDATGVTLEVTAADVLGELDGDTVMGVTVQVDTEHQGAAPQERTTAYALRTSGGDLRDVRSFTESDPPAVDSGVGLSSPTGAVARFVQLVHAEEWAALERLSGGVNDDRTELEVFASLLRATGRYSVAELPQFRSGSTRVVYVLDAVDLVIGQFEVSPGTPVQVVYFRTA